MRLSAGNRSWCLFVDVASQACVNYWGQEVSWVVSRYNGVNTRLQLHGGDDGDDDDDGDNNDGGGGDVGVARMLAYLYKLPVL